MDDQDIIIDSSLLEDIWRRRVRLWLILVPAAWAALLAVFLFRVPRSFSSTASVALQQSSGGMSGLATSLLASSATKTYVGVLQSHRFALAGAKAADIQRVYQLKTENAAAQMVKSSVKIAERDGLLYITTSLQGPPRYAVDAETRKAQIAAAAKKVTDSYVISLFSHLDSTNTNRDTALLREAEKQLQLARTEYDASVTRLSDFIKDSPILPDASGLRVSVPDDSPPESSATATAAGEMQALYLSKGQLEAEIKALEAARRATSNLVGGREENLTALPGEDPLLSEARRQVRSARTHLQNLRIDLAEENPDVVAAKERLRSAEARLTEESRSIQSGRTSDTIRLDALRAKYDSVTQQIAEVERNFQVGRRVMTDLQKRQNDVALRLEVLKTTAAQYATLSVQTVAGDSLAEVIDEAQVPETGGPGLVSLTAISFLLVLLFVTAWVVVEYVARSRRETRISNLATSSARKTRVL